MDATKQQTRASDIQTAMEPFFSETFHGEWVVQEFTNQVPKTVASLPIFSDDPTNIHVFYSGSSNVLVLMIGSGFGHWGLVLTRPGHDKTFRDARYIPWEGGVYFLDEYK